MNYMDKILRKESVITNKDNLEHLHTFKNFPVFFGCTSNPKEKDLTADMKWEIDPITGIIQLTELIPLDILYMEQHVDATGQTWSEYNNDFSEYVLKNKTGDVLEIGGGSGKIANIILSKDNNVNFTAVEPNPLFEEKDNLKIIKAFFSKDLKNQIGSNHTVIFSQVYEHVYNPEQFLLEINEFLPVGGKLIFAYPNLEYWFENKFTNTINFEHTMLITDYYVDYFLKKTGFNILEKIEYKNHSHFYTVEKTNIKENIILDNRYEHYKKMFNNYITYHENLVNQINKQIEETTSEVFLFGGHIFSQYLISFGLDTSRIVNILDNSPLKQEKRLYGTDLIVKTPKILSKYDNPVVILKAGLYNDEIKKDILENINPNVKFI
jgi:2-polyprenyl-3-methyl-5-hydroxy-6-metoxy-1,4-benzoquinol methylase